MNHRLAEARQRREDALPEISRLSLQGHTSREIAAKTGVPKTTVLRWRNSLRRECAARSVKETMALIDEMTDGYRTLYRKALKNLDRSQADKEIRTVTDSGGDDSNKKRSVRTETQAGNPAWLGQAHAALDSIGKLLKDTGPAGPSGKRGRRRRTDRLDGDPTRRPAEYVRCATGRFGKND